MINQSGGFVRAFIAENTLIIVSICQEVPRMQMINQSGGFVRAQLS